MSTPLPDLAPDADHHAAEAAFTAAGWTPCGRGDWAFALASPDGALVARISPFDPVGPYTAELYREAGPTGLVPALAAHRRLTGGGDLQVLERLDEASAREAEEFHGWVTTSGPPALLTPLRRIHERARAELPFCGPLDTNPTNVMRRPGGGLVLIDPFYADGPRLFGMAEGDPDGLVALIPEPQRRFLTEIPLAASGPWPDADRAAVRAALAAADARREGGGPSSAKMDG